tara:strand:- start:1116 stop:1628 length:513 start_codon:yes stop_codon:yes gene_type:complete
MDKEILIPTSWGDVTLGEFIELSKLDMKSYKSPVEYYIHMLRVFGNDDIESIFEYIKAVDLESIIGQMSFMNTPPRQLTNKSIKVGSEVFYLPENLNELTVGEYVSIEQMIETGKLDSVSAIPTILSVILRPKGETFDSNLCDERNELFKQSLSIEDTLGMSVFFSIGVR